MLHVKCYTFDFPLFTFHVKCASRVPVTQRSILLLDQLPHYLVTNEMHCFHCTQLTQLYYCYFTWLRLPRLTRTLKCGLFCQLSVTYDVSLGSTWSALLLFSLPFFFSSSLRSSQLSFDLHFTFTICHLQFTICYFTLIRLGPRSSQSVLFVLAGLLMMGSITLHETLPKEPVTSGENNRTGKHR